MTPKALASIALNLQATDRDVRSGLHMLLEHRLVVHFIHMVAGEQDDVLRARSFR